jgi:hypothetical protein
VIRPGPRTEKKRLTGFFLAERGITRCDLETVPLLPLERRSRLKFLQRVNRLYFVLGRFFRAALAPFLPRAVRGFLDKCAIVFFRRAALAAFLMFRFAAARCFLVVISQETNQ